MKKILGVICIACLTMFLSGCSKPSAKESAEKFFTAFESGDIETVKKYSTDKGYALANMVFANACGKTKYSECIPTEIPKGTFTVNKVVINPDNKTAIAFVTEISPKKNKVERKYKMFLENDIWLTEISK